MLDCQHASHLISQSMEVRLTWRQRFGLRLHLMVCDACTQFSRQMWLLRSALRQLGSRTENDETLQLSQEARERIARAVAQHGSSDAGQHPDQPI